jgi:acetyl-CoA carboxylase carboxyl transferase subunit alpha
MPDKEKDRKERDKDKKPAATGAWEKVLLARHVQRPHALDFINGLTKDFMELRGDRHFGDDAALVGGIAQFEGRTVLVLGNQKGRDTKENIYRNFGTARAEGYRKAFRLMQHAAKFKLPILTFVDTGGAFPGKESEERGIAVALAENIMLMSRLPVPIVSLVTGEGGSGGALAISVADRLLMLENAVYSVASPEGSATILWRDVSQAPAAAEAMKITAPDLLGFGIIDGIVPEPAGGAHTNPNEMMATAREYLLNNLTDLEDKYTSRGEAGIKAMLETRYQKYRRIGSWQELAQQPPEVGDLAGILQANSSL